jgi:hypothetical protein
MYLIGKSNSVLDESELVPGIERLANDSLLLCREKEKIREITAGWNIDVFVNELVSGMDELVKEFTEGKGVYKECS